MRNPIQKLVLVLFLASLAAAQSKDYWVKEDYRQWTEIECRKLLEFSHPNIRGPAERILIEFKIEKMMMQGAPVY